MSHCKIDVNLLFKAYKKYKSSVYFDKTELPVVEQIVNFEKNNSNLENKLNGIYKKLTDESYDWKDYTKEILNKIEVDICPKKLVSPKGNIIFNSSNRIEVESVQYFINLPIEGHILGVLWIFLIGTILDNRSDNEKSTMNKFSFGNRVSTRLLNKKHHCITPTPYLFEPYFAQFDSWRQEALASAKRQLSLNKDALIINLDIKRFFYSVNITRNMYNNILEECLKYYDEKESFILYRLHDFVYDVLHEYSDKVRMSDSLIDKMQSGNHGELHLWKDGKENKGVFLPIGFLPSNILSNWYLTPFDNVINNQINPVYYGRYVDDIILVDKVEEDSELSKKAKNNLEIADIIRHYFCKKNPNNIFISCNAGKSEKSNYRINPKILLPSSTEDSNKNNLYLTMQNDKIKVFYFNKNETAALIDCFENEIGQNASEFRFLPDIDGILLNRDYGDIIKIDNDDSSPKLRNINSFSLDKFALSKFLGKYRKVSRLIEDDNYEKIEEDLLKLLDKKELIDNYIFWDRMLEIMLLKNNFTHYKKLVLKIASAIFLMNKESKDEFIMAIRNSLIKILHVAICRTTTLCWGEKFDKIMLEIKEELGEDMKWIIEKSEEYKSHYWKSWMVNKYILPIPAPYIDIEKFDKKNIVNLSIYTDCIKYLKTSDIRSATVKLFLPYIISPHEISFALLLEKVHSEENIYNSVDFLEKEKKLWSYYNEFCYKVNEEENLLNKNIKSIKLFNKKSTDVNDKSNVKNFYAVKVGEDYKDKIKIGIGNIAMDEKVIDSILLGYPDRSYARYKKMSSILKMALKEKVDLLILPESYMPIDWLPDVYRFCANNQIGLITGIEHIVKNESVYNLTAIILPYKTDEYKFAHVEYHQKVHYSPGEKLHIENHYFNIKEGDTYTLFDWQNLWFSVYCCFELTSIAERSKFQSYADLIVAVEWNRDVNYFNNIIESLSRDLHCYCVQANNAKYGDNRIVLPASSYKKDLIKSKGGNNEIILTDTIDLNDLRKFQCQDYGAQKQDSRFKPTPPGFDWKISRNKMNKKLWERIYN